MDSSVYFPGDIMTTTPTKVNYKIYQGSTFNEVLRWESSTKAYANITGISKTAPVVLTAPTHGMPVGWRFTVSGVLGMKEINTEDYLIATSITTDTITVNSINASAYSTYISGGTIEYAAPKNLAGLAARMQIREKLSSLTTILELTTQNGGLIIDTIAKTITINITAAQTALLTFKTAVYSIEIIDNVTVIPLITGTLTLDLEITR